MKTFKCIIQSLLSIALLFSLLILRRTSKELDEARTALVVSKQNSVLAVAPTTPPPRIYGMGGRDKNGIYSCRYYLELDDPLISPLTITTRMKVSVERKKDGMVILTISNTPNK